MTRVVYEGKIDGDFEGFDDEVLFLTSDGSGWIQAEYKYWYHYAYCPDATVTEENGRYVLTVADNSVPVERAGEVITSRINGAFEGWKGGSEYSLLNGQVWRQSGNKYEYKYAHSPEAIVYQARGGFKMRVEGTVAEVTRVR